MSRRLSASGGNVGTSFYCFCSTLHAPRYFGGAMMPLEVGAFGARLYVRLRCSLGSFGRLLRYSGI
ncbi:MAG: hypothetical protein QME16_05740, partial [Planctomycetota bacterium]|nr:hypothetical protein [Planctomycetota bacterium]